MPSRLTFLQELILLTLCHVVTCHALNQTNSYSITDAIRQVNFCGAAYCTDPSFKSGQVQEWNCRACKATPYVEAKVFSGGLADANGFVGYEKRSNTIIVAFSGTDAVSKKNWIEDFDFPLIPYVHCKSCMVHNGFYLTMLSVIGQIKEAISLYQSIHKDAKISVTGHSLGAALACLTIAELSADDSFKSSMITTGHYIFGSPRVGNHAFAEWFASTASLTYRMVHGKDPVVHVPFQQMGFHHVHYEVRVCVTINFQSMFPLLQTYLLIGIL